MYELNYDRGFGLCYEGEIPCLHVLKSDRIYKFTDYPKYKILDFEIENSFVILNSEPFASRGTRKTKIIVVTLGGDIKYESDNDFVVNAKFISLFLIVETVKKKLQLIKPAESMVENLKIDSNLFRSVHDKSGGLLLPAENKKGKVFYLGLNGEISTVVNSRKLNIIYRVLIDLNDAVYVLDKAGVLAKICNNKMIWSIKLPPEKTELNPWSGPIFFNSKGQIVFNYSDNAYVNPKMNYVFISAENGKIEAQKTLSAEKAGGTIQSRYNSALFYTYGGKCIDFESEQILEPELNPQIVR